MGESKTSYFLMDGFMRLCRFGGSDIHATITDHPEEPLADTGAGVLEQRQPWEVGLCVCVGGVNLAEGPCQKPASWRRPPCRPQPGPLTAFAFCF